MEGITFIPGDFLLVEGRGFFDRLIQFGQHFRFSKVNASWNHVALIADNQGGIIEAITRGVTYGNIEKYKDFRLKYVHMELSDEDRRETVEYAMHCINNGYGFLNIFSTALTVLFGFRFVFGDSGENICSGLVAKSLEHGAVIFDKDASHMSPADLSLRFIKQQ